MSSRNFVGLGTTGPNVAFDHPVNLISIDGVSGAAGYLQLFDLGSVPPSNTPPDMVVAIPAAGPVPGIYGTFSPIPFNHGLAVAISSTAAVLTAVATTHSYWGTVEEWDGYNTADYETILTPVQTNGSKQTFWTDPDTSAKNKLLTVTAVNNSVSTRYLMMFAYADPPDGASPIAMWKVLPAETKKLDFGGEGQEVTSMDANGTVHNGCYFLWSSTGGPYLTEATGDSTNTVTGTFYSTTA